jgi:hypothetical protein
LLEICGSSPPTISTQPAPPHWFDKATEGEQEDGEQPEEHEAVLSVECELVSTRCRSVFDADDLASDLTPLCNRR